MYVNISFLEIARDHLHHCGHIVKGGFVSPVHDCYPKDTLISIKHRAAMLKLTLESSDWLHLSTWESEQKSWTATYEVLQHHQVNPFLLNLISSYFLLRCKLTYLLSGENS